MLDVITEDAGYVLKRRKGDDWDGKAVPAVDYY